MRSELEGLVDRATVGAAARAKDGRAVLGAVQEGINLVYANLEFQVRRVDLPGQPIAWGRTDRQPILALEVEGGKDIIPLAYDADVKGLQEPLASRVLDTLQVIGARREGARQAV